MPKASLSLKKNITKNQKAITQFFTSNQNVANNVLLGSQTVEVSLDSKSNKREVLSPVKVNQNEHSIDIDEPKQPSKKVKLDQEVKSITNYEKYLNNHVESKIKKKERKSPEKKQRNVQINDPENKNQGIKASSNNVIRHIKKEELIYDKISNEIKLNSKENCFSKFCDKNIPNVGIEDVKSKSPNKTVQSVSPLKNIQEVITNVDIDEFDFNKDNMFGEDWEVSDVEEDLIEDLDLSIMQRCKVLSINSLNNKLEIKLKNDDDKKGTCFVEGIWLNTPLQVGDVVSVIASRDSSDQFAVTNSSGLLVLRPDHLISTTSVVAGVFCKRKAVLQERWRGIDSANTAMTIGTLIHELVQRALTQRITSVAELRQMTDDIVRESIHMLYDAGLPEEEAISNMQMYIPHVAEFIQTYVIGKNHEIKKGNWNGRIEEVLDIEENVCCHGLGLKGKIDATLQVSTRDESGVKVDIVPLELKSGRASGSAEHRGQLVLYGMMLALLRGQNPADEPHTGLLLYLKDRVDLRKVSCGYPERRDLIMLRNDLVQHLTAGPVEIDPEQIADIEDVPRHLHQSLPEPVRNERACGNCAYLTICSLHLWHTDGPKVSDNHPLAKLKSEALGHLSSEHIKYFLQWTGLLMLEERGQISTSPLHALWTETAERRSKRGVCAANLKLKRMTPAGGARRYCHVFERELADDLQTGQSKLTKGPQAGEFSVVSVHQRPWVAAGIVSSADCRELTILLDRDLSRQDKDALFHVDMYESCSTTVQNLTNLGVLVEDSDRAHRLRRLIIDKEEAVFSEKLPREVGRLGAKMLRGLNLGQQRAVLRALAARRHVLLRGLPGTGKTQTVAVLVQLLVALRLRVLVTANAHAAVDNVLVRLPESMRVLRLGPAARVAPTLLPRTENEVSAGCTTAQQLQTVYESMEVVGVTCLGAAHAVLARTKFDVCIVDEATQVLQSTVIRALAAASRCVLVGDPDQLPPVVRAPHARRLGMEESLFHRLTSESCTNTLSVQYRMNQPLAELANTVSYGGQLQCADQAVALATVDLDTRKLPQFSEEDEWLRTACSLLPVDAAVFLDIELPTDRGTGDKSLANEYEACVVMCLIETLTRGGVKTSDIGVIAPYREQVALLRRRLAHESSALGHTAPDVSTVDQFQGRDKSVIVYSATKRQENVDKKVKEGEILNDQRRLAVTVTRAKHKFVMVGSSRALVRYAPLVRLMDACKRAPLTTNTLQRVYNKFTRALT